MGQFRFQRAQRKRRLLRISIVGGPGEGKTFTGIAVGSAIAEAFGQVLAVVDSEHRSSELYGEDPKRPGYYNPDEGIFKFDAAPLQPPYTFDRYIQACRDAIDDGYNVILVDSLSHAWIGQGGGLDTVDNIKAHSRNRHEMSAWATMSPMYRRFIDNLLALPAHLIFTTRSKIEWDLSGGKPEKVGTAAQMRDGWEYEVDIEIIMNPAHDCAVGKTRYRELDGRTFEKPGKNLADALLGLAQAGAEATPEDKTLLAADAGEDPSWAADRAEWERVTVNKGMNPEAIDEWFASKGKRLPRQMTDQERRSTYRWLISADGERRYMAFIAKANEQAAGGYDEEGPAEAPTEAYDEEGPAEEPAQAPAPAAAEAQAAEATVECASCSTLFTKGTTDADNIADTGLCVACDEASGKA